VYSPGTRLPLAAVRNVARQALLALDFLHRECKIVHTGKNIVPYRLQCNSSPNHFKDLKPDNFLISLPDAEEAVQRYIDGVSKSEELPTTPNNSSPSVVLSRPIDPFTPNDLQNPNYLSNYNIQLTDFGTGEQPLFQHFLGNQSDLESLFSGDGGWSACRRHPALRIARPRGYYRQRLGYQGGHLEFRMLGEYTSSLPSSAQY
jgi:serine/threonine protein kinase